MIIKMLLILFLKIYRIKRKTINGDIIIPAVILLMHNKKYKNDIVKNVILDLYRLRKI